MKYLVLISFCVFLASCGKDVDKAELTPGATGAVGATGANGADGATGSTGVSGATGTTGAAGKNGTNGSNGTNGTNGSNGSNGTNGSNGSPGLGEIPGISCAVHDLPNYNGSTTLPGAFIGNQILGTFVLPAFNIPDSQASLGFPGMPTALQNLVGTDGYALDCDGYINIATSGDNYVFQLLSDDGSELRINDAIVLSNQGQHAPSSTISVQVHLDRGLNKINIVYYQGPLTQIALQLSLAGPNLPNAVVPASAYTH